VEKTMMDVRIRQAILGFALLVGGGCGDAPLELSSSTLADHRARWSAAGIQDYQFEVLQQCECAPAMVRPAIVEVRRGAVTRVTYRTGEVAAPDARALFPTVDDLFDRIDEAIESEAATMTVSYDTVLGYPTQISIDYDLQVIDDEISIDASGLSAL